MENKVRLLEEKVKVLEGIEKRVQAIEDAEEIKKMHTVSTAFEYQKENGKWKFRKMKFTVPWPGPDPRYEK